MTSPRIFIPILGLLALAALFFSLPEIPDFFGIFKCKSCVSNHPYMSLIGAGYFTLLITISVLFPQFPSKAIAIGGFIWAASLAVFLTVFQMPKICVLCLFCHVCHVAMWGIWIFASIPSIKMIMGRERLILVLIAPVSIMALFGCMNLTFLIYNLKKNIAHSSSGIQVGDSVSLGNSLKPFEGKLNENLFINFISPQCPFCLKQLKKIESLLKENQNYPISIINVVPTLPDEITEKYFFMEWISDDSGDLRRQFKLAGVPTLIMLRKDGKILNVLTGINEEFEENFITGLKLTQEF